MAFCLKNLVSSQIEVLDPASLNLELPLSVKGNKDAFRKWCVDPGTQYCFYSYMEGINPHIRVGQENPVIKIHGIVADYDYPTPVDEARVLIDRVCKINKPNWLHLTYSCHIRLIWEFEQPVMVTGNEQANVYLKGFASKLKLEKILPGFDSASLRATMYYALGHSWERISVQKVPSDMLALWVYEIGKSYDWTENGKLPVIPLEIIAEEIQKRFPNRWTHEFALGVSGVRFWDPTADNPRGCVVRPTGMQCFTGPTPFMSWASIFGQEFVEQHAASTLGALLKNIWYDGVNYWYQDPLTPKKWYTWTKEDIKLLLRVKYNISSSKPKGKETSPLEEIMHSIHENKRVEAALPFHFNENTVVMVDHSRYLNIAESSCMEPAGEGSVSYWGDNFPWLANFLDNLFQNITERDYFLAWLAHFYVNAYRHEPRPGQALIISGNANRGKTLLSTFIVATMVGGFADASSFFLGEEKFTAHILSKPLMCIDDTAPATSQLRHIRYSAMLKKVTACQFHTFEQKYQKAGKIQWLGRVIITCNTDPESLRILPDLDISIRDKVSILLCNTSSFSFPDMYELRKIIYRELPYFCRWLIDNLSLLYNKFKRDSRMGIVSYHNSQLYDTALQQGYAGPFLEILEKFLVYYKKYHENRGTQKLEFWEGTTTDLFAEMMSIDAIKNLLGNITVVQLGTKLGILKARGFPLVSIKYAHKSYWRIPFSLIQEKEKELNKDSQIVISLERNENEN